MIGILTETPNGWKVKEKVSEDRLRTIQSYGDNLDEYPLHPDDVKLILEDRIDYPNMWVGTNEVEFEIVNVYVEPPDSIHCNRGSDVRYAKLIDSTINDDAWDDIFHDYQMDNYPSFGEPFTDALSLEEWLKNKFHPPVKK